MLWASCKMRYAGFTFAALNTEDRNFFGLVDDRIGRRICDRHNLMGCGYGYGYG